MYGTGGADYAEYDAGNAGYDNYGGGGGGFVGGAATNATPEGRHESGFGSGKKGTKSFVSKTIIPVTIATLRSCNPTPDNSGWVLSMPAGSRSAPFELSLVRIVARITHVEDAMTTVTYKLNDNTGDVSVSNFVSDDDASFAMLRGSLRPHTYCELVASVKYQSDASGAGAMSLQLWSIRPVADSNQITAHLLSCLYTYLLLSRGPIAASAGEHNTMGTGAFGGMMGAGYGMRSAGKALSNVAEVSAATGNPELDLILAAFTELGAGHADGASISSVVARVAHAGISLQAVQTAVETLAMDGYLYSTIDDHHFQITA